MTRIPRRAYAEMFGPTTGDRVRLADTNLIVEVEADYTLRAGSYGEEVKFGGGKTIRDGMAQSQLAEEMSIARPTATRALDGLERLGLIERQPGHSDRREIAVQPTEKGRSLRTGLNEASGAVTKRLKRQLGEDTFVETVLKIKGIRSALE